MCISLVLLAEGTAFDIAADEGGETGSPELGGDQLTCFQEAWVAGRFMIMAALENSAAKGVVCGDIDAALVGEDACFDLPIGESRPKGERDVLMHRLEGLKNEGVSCGGGFNAMREGGVNEVDKKGRREESDVGVVGVIRGK